MFEFYRGDTYQRNFSISWNNPITNIYFTVKSKSDEKHPLIKKKLNDGINFVDKNKDGAVYSLTIESKDTEKMSIGDYYFDIEVISGEIKQTPLVGILKINEDYTRKRDEY